MSLRCFIACAFGHRDVDNIYDQTISVALRDAGIVPVRVDRIEHNDDIDNRILDELNKCDMCIADLTYARPSVYFEAGDAIGQNKPVIFTCRDDHFHPKLEDPFGNHRIHFDLQMKNIISWTLEGKSFGRKLARRIEYVVRPIRLRLQRQEQTKAIHTKFMSMPDTAKFEEMLTHTVNVLRRNGFKVLPARYWSPSTGYIYAVRREKSINRFAVIELNSSTTKKQLEQYHRFFNRTRTTNLLETVNGSSKGRFVHIFCGSLRPITMRRVAEALPYFEPNFETKRFTYSAWGSDDKREFTDVHLFDNITSINDFVDEFKTRLHLVLQEPHKNSDTQDRSERKSRGK